MKKYVEKSELFVTFMIYAKKTFCAKRSFIDFCTLIFVLSLMSSNKKIVLLIAFHLIRVLF